MVKSGKKPHLVRLPIFPLPNSILYPGVAVSYHIYEDRYKMMLKHILETSSDLAVSYAPEAQPGQFFPRIICGAGPVQLVKAQSTGESDVLVFGARRIRFDSFVQESPYLIGEGEYLETDRNMPEKTEKDLLTSIRDMLIQWMFKIYDDPTRPIQLIRNIQDLEPLSFFVLFYFLQELDEKQKFLEENSLEVRAQKAWQLLKDLDASGDPGPPGESLIFPASSEDTLLN